MSALNPSGILQTLGALVVLVGPFLVGSVLESLLLGGVVA